MTVPDKKILNGETDVEDAYGSAGTPQNWKARGDASDGVVDSASRNKAPASDPKVADETGVVVNGTRFGPNSRGFSNTLAHNDGWHDEEFGG